MHPDRQVALVLRRINATPDAEAAAVQLFETWKGFVRFLNRVFEGRGTRIHVDLANRRLEESYRIVDSGAEWSVRPGKLLHHLGKNGISAVKNATYVAEFCRAFIADPSLFSVYGDAEYVAAFETIKDFEPEQIAVFEDYDIHAFSSREHVRECIISYHIPMGYVRGLWLGLVGHYASINASTVYELYSSNVPVEYARTASLAYAYFAMLRKTSGECVSELNPSPLSLGKWYAPLTAEFGKSGMSEPGWHTLALYRSGIPESYVKNVSLRSAADIIALYEAGVPDSYARAFHFSVEVPLSSRAANAALHKST